jgi:hypothetical protein
MRDKDGEGGGGKTREERERERERDHILHQGLDPTVRERERVKQGTGKDKPR